MIHFAIALHCEAQPIIQHYRMKPCGGHGRARFFQGENARLVITGVGSLSSAIAVTAFGERFPHSNALWLNLGVCGHKSASVGEAYIANKISSESSIDCFFPQLPWGAPWRGQEVRTINNPSNNYIEGQALDMEAYGFYCAANLFASSEYVHSIKIVSDNAASPASRNPLDKNKISRWITKQIPVIENFSEPILQSFRSGNPITWIPTIEYSVRSKCRLTETESRQLSTRLAKLSVLLDESDSTIVEEITSIEGKSELLAKLQSKIDELASQKVC